jgi:two-component sensor histidine kinase
MTVRNKIFSILFGVVGLPVGMEPGLTKTLGLQIIGLLVRQLDGTLSIDRTAGTSFSIRFRELRYKARI